MALPAAHYVFALYETLSADINNKSPLFKMMICMHVRATIIYQ